MANNILTTRIILCNDTAVNWGTSKKVLLKGEIGFELLDDGSVKMKSGNGVNTFADLPYVTMTPDEITAAINNAIAAASHNHGNKAILDAITASFTIALKNNYDAAYTHSAQAHAPSNAERNVLVGIQKNGTDITINSTTRKANITVPTKTSELQNDSGFKTTDTKYSAGTGLALSGTTLNHSNSVTANTAQGDASKTLTFGGTFTVPTVTYDAQGHITGSGQTTMTMPAAPTTISGNAGSATKLATSRTIDGVAFNGTASITHYAECSTAAATAAKEVSLTGFSLVTGAKIMVKFTATNTAASPTLNVNGTGAKAVMYRGAAISAGCLAANRVYEFVYDGTDWELVGDINTDSNNKVTNTLNTTAKAYITGTTSAATNTGTQVFDTGVYLDTTAGKLVAATFSGSLSGNAASATKLSSAKTISLSGAAAGTATGFDGSKNISIPVTSLNAVNLTLAESDALILNGGSASSN